MRMIDRFDVYMNYKHLNDNKVKNQLGLSNGVIGKSRYKGRDLSDQTIAKIAEYYTDLNIDWLRSGNGEMLRTSTIQNQYIEANNGTAINGHHISVEKETRAEADYRKLIEQIDRLIEQNNRLLSIIENLTK